MQVESIYLRSLELDDVERTYKWHNDPALYKSLVSTFRFISRASEEEWLRKAVAYSSQQINLAISLADNSQHIGNIYLREIDWAARHAELHVFIAESNQRSKGYGQAAVRLVIDYAFKELGLLRIYLFVLEENKPAVIVYKKCGFIVEGKLRQHAFKEGEHKDVLIMGICANDILSKQM